MRRSLTWTNGEGLGARIRASGSAEGWTQISKWEAESAEHPEGRPRTFKSLARTQQDEPRSKAENFGDLGTQFSSSHRQEEHNSLSIAFVGSLALASCSAIEIATKQRPEMAFSIPRSRYALREA